MNGFADLHIHTTASSGSLTPEAVVRCACGKGLRGIGITDIYTVEGCRQAAYAAKDLPLTVVPGVEIKSFYGDADIRILGYGIDTENELMLSVLNRLSEMSFEACVNICAKLKKTGINISMAALFDRFGCHVITRGHIAEYLTEEGAVKSRGRAWEEYIGKGACAYVPEYKMSPEQSCTLINLAGGISVLAAPGELEPENELEFRKMLRKLKAAGLAGIEVMHPNHTPHFESFLKSEALRAGLLAFGGSDFQGELSPEIEIGTGTGTLMVPADVLKCIPGVKI